MDINQIMQWIRSIIINPILDIGGFIAAIYAIGSAITPIFRAIKQRLAQRARKRSSSASVLAPPPTQGTAVQPLLPNQQPSFPQSRHLYPSAPIPSPNYQPGSPPPQIPPYPYNPPVINATPSQPLQPAIAQKTSPIHYPWIFAGYVFWLVSYIFSLSIATAGSPLNPFVILLLVAGDLIYLIVWILTLIKTAQLKRWGWFIGMFLSIGFGVISFSIFGPTARATVIQSNQPIIAYPDNSNRRRNITIAILAPIAVVVVLCFVIFAVALIAHPSVHNLSTTTSSQTLSNNNTSQSTSDFSSTTNLPYIVGQYSGCLTLQAGYKFNVDINIQSEYTNGTINGVLLNFPAGTNYRSNADPFSGYYNTNGSLSFSTNGKVMFNGAIIPQSSVYGTLSNIRLANISGTTQGSLTTAYGTHYC